MPNLLQCTIKSCAKNLAYSHAFQALLDDAARGEAIALKPATFRGGVGTRNSLPVALRCEVQLIDQDWRRLLRFGHDDVCRFEISMRRLALMRRIEIV